MGAMSTDSVIRSIVWRDDKIAETDIDFSTISARLADPEQLLARAEVGLDLGDLLRHQLTVLELLQQEEQAGGDQGHHAADDDGHLQGQRASRARQGACRRLPGRVHSAAVSQALSVAVL